ncbi:MAG: cysteine desulfurase family protein [Planctomycetota bacterium]|jgi:cysteine desulfurase
MIYLDHNATAPTDPSVAAAVTEALASAWANPSSPHRAGQSARRTLERPRAAMAALLGAAPGRSDLVFVSGGTEADTLALRGRLDPASGRTLILTARTEHAAVRETAATLAAAGTAEVHWLATDPAGRVRPEELDRGLREIPDASRRVAVVSVSWANNETGVLQPVDALGEVCRRHRVALHVDAVQWVGRGPVDFDRRPIDLLSVAAHKFGGPKGVGVLAVRRGVHLVADIAGGAQESGRRAGTENVPGIAGAAAAAEAARARVDALDAAAVARLEARRDAFETRILAAVPGARVHGADVPRLWNTSSIGVAGVDAATALLMLSERGVCAAAGAACSSGSIEPSPVLLAMGVPESVAAGTIRFSWGHDTARDQLEAAAEIVIAVLRDLAGG